MLMLINLIVTFRKSISLVFVMFLCSQSDRVVGLVGCESPSTSDSAGLEGQSTDQYGRSASAKSPGVIPGQ